MDDLHLELELAGVADERDHDFGLDLDAFLDALGGGFEDGPRLHFGDFRVGDGETATTVAEHRVEFVEVVHALLDVLDIDAEFLGEVHLLLLGVREELVERRIQKTDRAGLAFECLEDAEEVFALVREKLLEGFLAVLLVGREDHLAHRSRCGRLRRTCARCG